MEYKKRLLEKTILELFNYYPVVAVLGARQVGKSTIVENLFKDRIQTIVFDPVIDIGNARNDPDFFLQNISTPAFLDEIQYAPELLNSIKRKVDNKKQNGLYIISGSQNLSVLKNISESLAGRVAIINLMAMSRKEINESQEPSFINSWIQRDSVNPDKIVSLEPMPVYPHIWKGGYPKIMELPEHLVPGYWESYLQTYIERDVRRVANIGSLQTYGNFIGLLSAHTSGEINHNQLGRELGIDRKTALAWTEIAQATFQWFSIPPFSRNPVKKIAGKSKGYFADTGFISYLQRISMPDVIANHPMRGKLFETYVVLEILKNIQNIPAKPNLYHFRSYSGAEVDLILERNGKLFPIEIKMKSNPGRKDVKGFDSLKNCFPQENFHTGLVICSIERPQMIAEDVLAVPWWVV
ncbi:ATP-binding protein [Desulfobacterales bacterium HSG17]|nr:ATP-binding protein [Desulfobacterales bacterium HSG17]